MRLVAFSRQDRTLAWGLARDDGAVWDGAKHTDRTLEEVQTVLVSLPDNRQFVREIGLDAPATFPADEHLDALKGRLRLPWHPPEVWAAGVTYRASEDARMRESQQADIYRAVYGATRPELFFKAVGSRVRGPGEPVGLRTDSSWQVPEPELAVAIGAQGRIIGYLCGNDMSCRDIEGENPLYLPQAKVYDGSCALGPALLLSDEDGFKGRRIRLEIVRSGAVAFEGSTTTDLLIRSPAELAAWLCRAYTLMPGTVLLTGTGIVPPDTFSLEPGDLIRIEIEGIGVLANECRTIRASEISG